MPWPGHSDLRVWSGPDPGPRGPGLNPGQSTDDDFKISDNQFKVLISSSLPPAWDVFTEAYVGRRKDIPETDPKKLMSSQQFIGIIKEEAIHRDAR